MATIFGKNNNSDTQIPVFEGYSVEFGGAMQALQESFDDQLNIVQAIHAMDCEDLGHRKSIKALQESGADQAEIDAANQKFEVTMEGLAGNAWEGIKKFFSNLAGKFKAFFASVIRFFNGFIKSGKDFATKYEKELRRLTLSGYKVKLYKYDESKLKANEAAGFLTKAESTLKSLLVDAPESASADTLKAAIEKIQEKKEDVMDELRGEYTSGGSIKSSEYSEALFGHFRSGAKGESDKEEVSVEIGTIITTLKDEEPLKAAQAADTASNKAFQEKITKVGKMEKAANDAIGKKGNSEGENNTKAYLVSYAHKEAGLFSEACTVAMQFFTAWKTAITERESAYKSVCTSAFRYKEKKDN